jgi:hypothetical protein
MRESRFLCLAVSRRDGGNCIAGVDVDTDVWIRPVNPKNHGALHDFEIVVKDHKTRKLRMMAPLDLMQMRLDEPVGSSGQPENWTLAAAPSGEPYPVLCQVEDDPLLAAKVRDLEQQYGQFRLIFGTPDNKVAHIAIEKEPVPHSLCVVRPKNLIWVRTTNFRNNPRIEGHFDFGKRNTRYCLPLTDIAWEPKLLKQTLTKTTVDASESAGMKADTEILLTISLGDHFKEKGFHYKLIAGVLLLPKG